MKQNVVLTLPCQAYAVRRRREPRSWLQLDVQLPRYSVVAPEPTFAKFSYHAKALSRTNTKQVRVHVRSGGVRNCVETQRAALIQCFSDQKNLCWRRQDMRMTAEARISHDLNHKLMCWCRDACSWVHIPRGLDRRFEEASSRTIANIERQLLL
jgi:hypothetical protein